MKDKIIKNYINNLTKEDIYNFAYKNNITLNDHELNYIFKIIKEKKSDILYNPEPIFKDLKNNINPSNYSKITSLYLIYKNKYQSLL